MAIERTRSKRKASGGRYVDYRKSRKHAKVNKPLLPKIGESRRKTTRTRGGAQKQKILQIDTINVADPKKKTIKKVKLSSVLENQADRNFVVRNILTMGAIVQTDLGKVKITSRPGQTGTLNGVLVE